MDRTFRKGRDYGGPKVDRPRPPKEELIMDSFAYGRLSRPVNWGNFPGGPAPPTGTGSQIPWMSFPGGPAPPTGTGTFKPVWSKPKESSRRQSKRIPEKACSIVDGEPWFIKDRPAKPGPLVIVDGWGNPVSHPDIESQSHEELFQMIRKRSLEAGFDLTNPPAFIPSEIPYGITFVTEHERNLLVFQLREDLKYSEERFKREYSYGISAYGSSDPFTGTMEVRHCLSVGSHDAFCWMEKSSAVEWVGVYGINAMCVVTLCGHVDWKRVHGGLATTDAKTVLSLFRKCVLSELEDLAVPRDESRRRVDVPFCVASATPGTIETPYEDGVEISSVDYAVKAIDFVRSSGLLPKGEGSDAAIQLAISAFERLMERKIVAEEIEVTVVSGRSHGFPTYKDLGISEMSDILATIHNTSETVV